MSNKNGVRGINPTLALSTTTTLGRVRGFTICLLYLLYEGGARCCELAQKTGKSQKYVYQYLSNMRKYGLTVQDGVFWHLTDLGVAFTEYLKRYDSILYNNILEYPKKDKRKIKEYPKKDKSSTSKKPKQLRISAWLANSSLDDVEGKVVEVLVKHYNETGSPFLYFSDHYEAAEFFGCRPEQIVNAMRRLKQDRIAYTWRDRSLRAWKIGLYKDWVRGLLEVEKKLSSGEADD